MKLFYFVGRPVDGQQEAFFLRLAEVGGSPPGWRFYPHAGRDGRALHLVEARDEGEIEVHLAQFGSTYQRGPIVEVIAGGRARSPARAGARFRTRGPRGHPDGWSADALR